MKPYAIAFIGVLAGCSSTTGAESTDAGSPADTAAPMPDVPTETGASAEIRGKRYCEVLLANVGATEVKIDVYGTFGLNDCPNDLWGKVDAKAITAETGATQVVLNGPRYWMLDGFERGVLKDPTPRTFGGIAMRLAANIVVPIASIGAFGKAPYTQTSVQRDTTVRFDAGKSVYELVGPDGAVYEMQSYSIQKVPQTEADLASLGARLTLPKGWVYRTRILTAPLLVTAVGGVATVIQDDFGNTYQLSAR